jgi:hypothetical protein|tara:strand:- start:95 stop:691 length:597 start_codon:yes stop_codon:yes gene_type:complete
MTPRIIPLSIFLLSSGSFVFAAEEAEKPRIGEMEIEAKAEKKADVPIENVKIKRTTVFDEAEIKKLYKSAKLHNDKMNEGLPAHLNGEEMDVITLKTLNVEGNDLREQRDLMERLDPRPRQRLARLREIDPDAAHEMMVTMRNDEAFMAGANDRGVSAGNPGRAGYFDSRQMARALDKALGALNKALGKKKREEGDSE